MTEMLYLKACPRCRGDINFVNDTYGPSLQCLQCGFTVTSANREVIAAGLPQKPAAPHAARKRTADGPLPRRGRISAAS